MGNGVFYCSFKLKAGVDRSEFLAAAKELNDKYISKQKGYISWKQMVDGDLWADFLTFETLEDVKEFEANSENAGELARKFYSFIDFAGMKMNCFTVEGSY